VRPRTAAQKFAAACASRASKATPNMLLDMMRTFLWCGGQGLTSPHQKS
jgi:hypothetical protein